LGVEAVLKFETSTVWAPRLWEHVYKDQREVSKSWKKSGKLDNRQLFNFDYDYVAIG
jgi:hypothetical protein